jgi:3-methylcrotonyl-CoA carboxylase alpha subunit
MFLEQAVVRPRHIEVQILADATGETVHLFERDCSVQRRHQKVIEEAPAPGMDAERRRAMGDAAIAAATAIGYVGAGTVEFIAQRDGAFYFMEMNTRLQVEHPVTEMVTGQDLVEWQLRVAAGEPLPQSQAALAIRGHAIEARIYAEDPERGFLPSIGRITHWRMPQASADVRVDTGFRAGDDVTPFYDPMLAKVIAWGEDRSAARATLLKALAECEVTGVSTNVAFVERVLAHEAFASGRFDTGLIDANRAALLETAGDVPASALVAAAVAEYRAVDAAAARSAAASSDRWSPWNLRDAWWNGTSTHGLAFRFGRDAHTYEMSVRPRHDGSLDVRGAQVVATVRVEPEGEGLRIHGLGASGVAGDPLVTTVVRDAGVRHVFAPGVRVRLACIDPLARAGDETEHGGHLTAPMSGTIVAVMVDAGDDVDKGAPLVVLEAMKMEHTIVAPAAGRVAAVHFAVGDRVAEGADMVDLEARVPSEARVVSR